MYDTSDILQSSVLFWTLSLIPATIFPYLTLGLLSTSFIIYGLHYSCPTVTLDRLDNTITAVEEILTHAKAKCMRDYLALVKAETQFLRTKLAASRLHSRLLEAHNMPGWKTYLCDIFTILRALAILGREVRDIKMSFLVLIEAAHQRKLTKDIHEGQEIVDSVLQPYYSVRTRVHGQPTEFRRIRTSGIKPLHFNLAGLVLAVGNPAPYTVPNLLVFAYVLCEFALVGSFDEHLIQFTWAVIQLINGHLPWPNQRDMEWHVLNVNPDAEVVPTGNAKIGGHAAITDIASIGQNRDVMYCTRRFMFHAQKMANRKASLRHQGNDPSDRNADLVVVESVEHLLNGILK
ncbi:hypothetical protein DFH08DRAFT_1001070 [Mycena albidolilacea]|uniref:Uncharacterized protein n=1 Tax=Mycena albidolilacea TaxID=1033008 RepID=A0AAD7ESH5_9AGAR|nr:hypothetical protein DFH08DRAFT_1001070 [Mycena albidolilacea]